MAADDRPLAYAGPGGGASKKACSINRVANNHPYYNLLKADIGAFCQTSAEIYNLSNIDYPLFLKKIEFLEEYFFCFVGSFSAI